MPVGTQGTVKGLLPRDVRACGAEIVLGNTYHLMLRPGESTVARLGGLQRFSGWNGPMLTDSGGFQVFSLADISRIDDDGVTFRSHIDGSVVQLTPERSISVQNALGADIIMMFDECPDPHRPIEYQQQAVKRTLDWATRCVRAHARTDEQALFGIVQGGVDAELRRYCARELVSMDLPGYAIGGLAVGEGFEAMMGVLDVVTPLLPADRPRYLMGVGFPRDLISAVARGVDMFDCVMPTRNGRNAYAFHRDGPLRLRNARFAEDAAPIDADCDCPACRSFSRGALRHFFFAGEMLGPILVSLHNIRFYQRLMADIRNAISAGRFSEFMQSDPRRLLGPACDLAADGRSPGD